MGFRVLADATVVLHLGFVLFVVLGGLIVARWRRVAWVHLPAAAWAHGSSSPAGSALSLPSKTGCASKAVGLPTPPASLSTTCCPSSTQSRYPASSNGCWVVWCCSSTPSCTSSFSGMVCGGRRSEDSQPARSSRSWRDAAWLMLTNQGLPAVDILRRVRCAFQRTKLEVVRHKARRTLLVAEYLWRIR